LYLDEAVATVRQQTEEIVALVPTEAKRLHTILGVWPRPRTAAVIVAELGVDIGVVVVSAVPPPRGAFRGSDLTLE
jgi:hypothetical protein